MEATKSRRQLYVCGFMFHRGSVLLVEKKVPPWQAGLWNGVGGKVEPAETTQEAMIREFKEETGLDTDTLAGGPLPHWHSFCLEHRFDDYAVHFLRAQVPDSEDQPQVPEHNDVGEWLQWRSLSFLEDSMARVKVVGNLHWLLPLALDPRACYAEVHTLGDIRERPSW